MLTSPLEIVAERVVNYLHGKGADRHDESNNMVGAYVTVVDMCLDLDMDKVSDWPKVKRYMVEHGYPIAYLPGKGHYLGEAGEEVLNDFYRFRTALSYYRRFPGLKKRLQSVNEAGGKSWGFLSRTYGVSNIDQLEGENLKRVKKDETEG